MIGTAAAIGTLLVATSASSVRAGEDMNTFFTFTGTNYVDVNASAGNVFAPIKTASGLTLEMWVRRSPKHDDKSGMQMAYGVTATPEQGLKNGYPALGLYSNSDSIVCTSGGTSANNWQHVQSKSTLAELLPKGEWVHLACTENYAKQTLSLYRNGKLLATAPAKAKNIDLETLRIGEVIKESHGLPSWMIQPGYAFVGDITGVRIWQVERSEDEISRAMSQSASELSSSELENLLAYGKVSSTVNFATAPKGPSLPCGQGSMCIFVTTAEWGGSVLGGLAGADARCQEAAQNGKLPGTYKAWLSSSTTSAASRLTHATVPYKRPDGTVVANNWDDLIDGTLAASISITETGVAKPQGRSTWTATNPDGTKIPDNTSRSCNEWTGDSAHQPNIGSYQATDAKWTNYASEACSHTAMALYCLQQ